MKKKQTNDGLLLALRRDVVVGYTFLGVFVVQILFTAVFLISASSSGSVGEVAPLVIPLIVSIVLTGLVSSRLIAGMNLPAFFRCVLVIILGLVTFAMLPVFFAVFAKIARK
jgi:hypothetical protein